MFSKNLSKFLLLLTFLFSFGGSQLVYGQISKGGTPPSIKYGIKSSGKVIGLTPSTSINALKIEDAESSETGKPMRAGISVPVNLDINNSGEWTALPDGRMLWRISLRADSAYALGVVFDKFELPEKSELYLYDSKKRMILGAFGSHNNNDAKVLSTRVLPGCEIVIEYIEFPSGKPESKGLNSDSLKLSLPKLNASAYQSQATLSIGELAYVYLNAFVFENTDGSKPATGASSSCMVNINCSPVGDKFQNQKRGVAHMFYPKGSDWYFCTGSLVNNTAQDGTPYFLTACHCGEGSTEVDFPRWQFYFNYEYEGCENTGTPNTGDVLTGCTYRASGALDGGSDFYLVELTNLPPAEYSVYYNGWSREEEGAPSGAGIHHPKGDVKKISTFATPLTATHVTFQGAGTMATNSAWKVLWSQNENGYGVTQPGSSGSPLFNSVGLQVGTLTGGSSSCEVPTNNEYYGRIAYHWQSNGTSSDKQLAPWLDPLGTNPINLSGFDPNSINEPPVADFKISQTSVATGAKVYFTDISTNASTSWKWSFEDAFPSFSTFRKNEVVWVTPGEHKVKLIAFNAYGSDTITKTITVSEFGLPSVNPVIIGTGTTTSLYPLGADGTTVGNRVRSASIYTAQELGGVGQISKLEWYVGTLQADTRNVSIYIKETNSSSFTACTQDDIIQGATLVYNGTFMPNSMGWVGVDLDTKYQYYGQKNLLVMVYANTSFTDNLNSNCYCSPAEGMHQHWAARISDPVGNGVVDANRPNIRITFSEFQTPIAWFGVKDTIFALNFEEGETFPSDGWSVINSDEGGVNWVLSQKEGNSFAAHQYGARSYFEEGWLISPQISLPADAAYQLNFYSCIKDSKFYISGKSSVLISTTGTNPEDFTQVWFPSEISEEWIESHINLTQYAGQSIRIAFLYKGTYAHTWCLDSISLCSLDISPITVFEGESVNLYTFSTGNPVAYEWSTPGASKALSLAKDAALIYKEVGVHDVSLTVGNFAGKNQKTIPNYITVKGKISTAGFTASGNLKTFDHHPFIPVGGTVNFTDSSIPVPSSWDWAFEGGNPSSSNIQNPKVTYSIEGLYDVSLSAVNDYGSTAIDSTDCIKVGGSDYASNLLSDDKLSTYLLNKGYLPGHGIYTQGFSTYYFYQYAEFFKNSHSGKVSAIKVAVISNLGAGKYVKFKVWDGSTGKPGTELASKSVEIASLQASEFNTITLDSPIAVAGNFFIGFEVSYDSPHNFDSHCFSSTTARDRDNSFSSAWVKWGTSVSDAQWSSISQLFSLETSLAIFPYFTYDKSNGVDDNLGNSNSLTLFPNPTTGEFSVQVNYPQSAKVEVVVTDLLGRTVMQTSKMNISDGFQVFNLTLPRNLSNGVYLVQVLGYGANGMVTSQQSKLLLQGK